jgi:aerobic carbon-monoxide dehydrogenase large subunit
VSLIGTSVARIEDARLLVGAHSYVADLDLPDALTVTYVTSQMAHARLRGVDVTAARAAPGVVDVVTAADLDPELRRLRPTNTSAPPETSRPLLATERVRFVGEPLVVILSKTREQGADAATLVEVDYEPLPAVVGVDDARRDEVLLFPEIGTNLIAASGGGTEDVSFDRCEVVVRATILNQRLAPCPLETRAGAARWEPDGRLTLWSSSQGAHAVRVLVAATLRLDRESIRVIVPDVGGSFGAKGRPHPEEVLLGWLSRRVGRPVRWVPDRTADMNGLVHSRAQVQHVEVGGTRDGIVEVLCAHIDADGGAYGGGGMAGNTGALLPGAYHIPQVAWTADILATTTVPIGAYRGAGRPEAGALIERAIDLFAAEIGMDPVEVRRRNLVRADEMPYTSPTGVIYDSGDYEAALDLALDAVDIASLRADQARRRAAGDDKLLGIGVAVFVDRTAGVGGSEYGAVDLRPDGSVLVRSGSTPFGQGHHTAWSMLVAERTGLPFERIEIVHGDTDHVPRSGVTSGSRSTQLAGSAIAEATDALVVSARELAAHLLEASVDDIVIDHESGGRFHVAGTPSIAVGWDDIARRHAEDDDDGLGLRCESDFENENPTVPYGAYVCVVEVDRETGGYELLRMVTVDDAGTILNPLTALGQVHGGIGQGLAQAMFEEFVYDEDGNPLTSTFVDYAMPSAADLPLYESTLVETPSPFNPLGFKGIAESGAIGAPPAIQNAVVDAVAHLGVRHIDMPLTAERVWRAIDSATRSERTPGRPS